MADVCPTVLTPGDLPLYFDFLRTTVVPVGCVWLGFWLKGFESRKDATRKQVEVIGDEIEALLAVASLYWRTNSDSPKSGEEVASEAEIIGRLHGINTLFEAIVGKCNEKRTTNVRTSISELRQTLTGGQFGAEAGHSANGAVISKSYSVAAELRIRLEACL